MYLYPLLSNSALLFSNLVAKSYISGFQTLDTITHKFSYNLLNMLFSIVNTCSNALKPLIQTTSPILQRKIAINCFGMCSCWKISVELADQDGPIVQFALLTFSLCNITTIDSPNCNRFVSLISLTANDAKATYSDYALSLKFQKPPLRIFYKLEIIRHDITNHVIFSASTICRSLSSIQ